ncbi:MAG: nuclear transport factor 2 family protein [Acidobacteriota bacterium]|nr:nuclear transport factor 2 family protein [Acidobacteriota bacterium]
MQSIYAAFGRADVPAILAHLAPGIEWVVAGAPTIPDGRTHRGPADVATFFQSLDSLLQFTSFEPKEFLSDGEVVVALGSYQSSGRATGRAADDDWAMVWRFKEGRVVHYQAHLDTLSVAKSLR